MYQRTNIEFEEKYFRKFDKILTIASHPDETKTKSRKILGNVCSVACSTFRYTNFFPCVFSVS